KMGSVSLKIGDGTARFKRATLCSSAVNILMLFSVITTNLFALYAFTSAPKHQQSHPLVHTHKNISLISEKVSLILREIDSSQKKLAQMEKELLGYETIDLSRPNIANELKLFLQHHQLPLGKDSRTGITEMVASVGHSCEKSKDLLSHYMSYKVFGPCPDDWSLAQRMILRGCEPLPRRRCFAKSIAKVGLHSFPVSLWKPVSDKIVTWSGLGCKSFECVNGKKLSRDCVGCFDLVNGNENQRFVKIRGKNDFLIDDVLALGGGGIRIGFDIGGGSGTFAARMAERNVTMITNTLNIDAPYSEFIAARGLFPLYLSLDHRFPFYDNVFDLVHASSGLDVGDRPEKLEFLMFDIDRILRAGGLFWLDNFYCANDEKKRALTLLIEPFGYKKLKWVVGEKLDAAGSGKSEVYLSAVLQKPVRV
ncbi:Methyltransf_29 domain-containing protein, partial [Cephalotus follicularis]